MNQRRIGKIIAKEIRNLEAGETMAIGHPVTADLWYTVVCAMPTQATIVKRQAAVTVDLAVRPLP